MKWVWIFLTIPFSGFSQKSHDEVAEKLTQLYTENASWVDKSFSYKPNKQILELSGYLIGVNDNTLVKSEIDRGEEQKFRVSFYCQNGTSISNIQNPNQANAFLSVPLKTKKACREFVKLFEALRRSI